MANRLFQNLSNSSLKSLTSKEKKIFLMDTYLKTYFPKLIIELHNQPQKIGFLSAPVSWLTVHSTHCINNNIENPREQPQLRNLQSSLINTSHNNTTTFIRGFHTIILYDFIIKLCSKHFLKKLRYFLE